MGNKEIQELKSALCDILYALLALNNALSPHAESYEVHRLLEAAHTSIDNIKSDNHG